MKLSKSPFVNSSPSNRFQDLQSDCHLILHGILLPSLLQGANHRKKRRRSWMVGENMAKRHEFGSLFGDLSPPLCLFQRSGTKGISCGDVWNQVVLSGNWWKINLLNQQCLAAWFISHITLKTEAEIPKFSAKSLRTGSRNPNP